MSLATRVVTMVGVARTVVGHPAVQVAISVAPLLLTPQVKQAAREVTLSAAYNAGVVARKIVRRG